MTEQFAYESHTACDRHSFALGVEVTAGNVHDSVAWDALYDQVTSRFQQVEHVVQEFLDLVEAMQNRTGKTVLPPEKKRLLRVSSPTRRRSAPCAIRTIVFAC